MISVVTPVYNGENFLVQCIESVLAQTYDQWEYIIVDNCSTDRSAEIATSFARGDARIRVVRNHRHLSALENQNHALRQISDASQFCKVVHADDWIFPRCLEEMVQIGQRHASIGIVGAYRLNERSVDLDGLPPSATVLSGHEICRRTLLGEVYVFGSPTALLIRSDLVRAHHPFYDERHPWADVQACYELLQESDFGFVHQVLTFTRRHSESQSSLRRRLNTHMVGSLDHLLRYGHVFLDDGEYRHRFRAALTEYYRFLARSVLQRQGGDFWTYHREAMRELGLPLSPMRIGLGLTDLTLRSLMNPARRFWKAIHPPAL